MLCLVSMSFVVALFPCVVCLGWLGWLVSLCFVSLKLCVLLWFSAYIPVLCAFGCRNFGLLCLAEGQLVNLRWALRAHFDVIFRSGLSPQLLICQHTSLFCIPAKPSSIFTSTNFVYFTSPGTIALSWWRGLSAPVSLEAELSGAYCSW